MKKAVIYARYSSERQTEQSIEGQLSVCKKFALDNDFAVLDEYIDRATTGTNDNRLAFQTMIRDSARREWQYVIVYKGDRFSRNRIESAIHKKTLRDNGVKLVSATENIPDSPEGIILESLLEGMAEYYSAELSQKVKRGLNESRKKKQFTGGFLLYGWDLVDKKPVINTDEASVVLEVHTDYANGKTARDIVSALAGKGIRDKRGKAFNMAAIYRMLNQQKYVGNDIYPAIVPKEIKERVNAIIEKNKHAPSRRKSIGNYLLSGKLICGECGGLMTGEAGTSKTGAVYQYYKCYEKKKHTKPCTMPSIKKDDIENKVFDVCCGVLNAGFIPHIVDAAYKIHQEELESNIAIINLQALLTEKEKAIGNIMKAIEQGIITSTTKQRLTELEEEVESIKNKIACEKSKAEAALTKEDYHSFLSKFIGQQYQNDEFKQEVIDLLIRQVVVFRDRIRITFNYSPDDKKGNRRDYKVDISELAEAQREHKKGLKSSNLFILSPPQKGTPFSGCLFVPWGIWTRATEARGSRRNPFGERVSASDKPENLVLRTGRLPLGAGLGCRRGR